MINVSRSDDFNDGFSENVKNYQNKEKSMYYFAYHIHNVFHDICTLAKFCPQIH